jgi:hypothetical protein
MHLPRAAAGPLQPPHDRTGAGEEMPRYMIAKLGRFDERETPLAIKKPPNGGFFHLDCQTSG